MAIINTNPTTDSVATAVASHKAQVQAFYTRLLIDFKRLGAGFWANPKYTPMQMAEGYGADATDLFTLSSKLQAFIADVAGVNVPIVPDGYTVTPIVGGGVTITPPAAPQPEPNPTLPGSTGGV